MTDNEIKIYQDEIDEAYELLWAAYARAWKIGAIALLVGLAIGWLIWHKPAQFTVEQVMRGMPLEVKRAIAIDYCSSGAAQRKMCDAPMDSHAGGK